MKRTLPALLVILFFLSGCRGLPLPVDSPSPAPAPTVSAELSPSPSAVLSLDELPPYDGSPWVELAGEPVFSKEDLEGPVFSRFSPLDELGRCGPAEAKLGPETMPTAEREGIGQIKPAGWHTVRYDFIDGKYLYNRCHLIGYQLSGENANPLNLITGTRYLNVAGMLPLENQVADYMRSTGDHVLYRVTPIYDGDDLVCAGVELEALSVEEGGLSLHYFLYNVQPGVVIDYATGESIAAEEPSPTASPAGTPQPPQANTPEPTPGPESEGSGAAYVLNTRSNRFHLPDCPGVASMSEGNRRDTNESREELIAQGWIPCGTCKP